jgi:hypothetical protein
MASGFLNYRLEFDILGTKDDIRSFWKKIQSDEAEKMPPFTMEFEGTPSEENHVFGILSISNKSPLLGDSEKYDEYIEKFVGYFPALNFCFSWTFDSEEASRWTENGHEYKERVGYWISNQGEVDSEFWTIDDDSWENLLEQISENRMRFYATWTYLPMSMRTKEKCLLFLTDEDFMLENVPEEYWQDMDFCVAAVKEDSQLLDWVPKSLTAKVKKAAGIK